MTTPTASGRAFRLAAIVLAFCIAACSSGEATDAGPIFTELSPTSITSRSDSLEPVVFTVDLPPYADLEPDVDITIVSVAPVDVRDGVVSSVAIRHWTDLTTAIPGTGTAWDGGPLAFADLPASDDDTGGLLSVGSEFRPVLSLQLEPTSPTADAVAGNIAIQYRLAGRSGEVVLPVVFAICRTEAGSAASPCG